MASITSSAACAASSSKPSPGGRSRPEPLRGGVGSSAAAECSEPAVQAAGGAAGQLERLGNVHGEKKPARIGKREPSRSQLDQQPVAARVGVDAEHEAVGARALDPLRDRRVVLRLGWERGRAGEAQAQLARRVAERVRQQEAPEIAPVIEHEDAEPELPCEQRVRGAVHVVERREADEVALAGRVVDVRFAPVAPRRGLGDPSQAGTGVRGADQRQRLPGARLSIGISIAEQSELKVPITATSSFAPRVGVRVRGARAAVEVAGLRGRVVAGAIADGELPGPEVALLEHQPDRVRQSAAPTPGSPLERQVRRDEDVGLGRPRAARRTSRSPSAEVSPAALTQASSPRRRPSPVPRRRAASSSVFTSMRDTVPSL